MVASAIMLVWSFVVWSNDSGLAAFVWDRHPIEGVAPEREHAYVAPLGTDRFSAHLGPSPAQVLEDGVPLAHANALHDDIRQFGGGRFSFWHEVVYFSTSDNTDPRTNGRTYAASFPAQSDRRLSRLLYGLTLAVVIGALGFVAAAGARMDPNGGARPAGPAGRGGLARSRALPLLAGWMAVLAIVRDLILLEVFWIGATSDSITHIDQTSFRSRPYALMAGLAGLRVDGGDPVWLVLLQIALGGFAVGALVYVVGRRDAVLAAVIGVLLLLDLNWASSNRWLMTEGPFMSFHLLALALLVYQFERRRSLRGWELLCAGAFYAWAVSLRPSGLLLSAPIGLAYAWFLPSRRKVALVGAGFAVLLLGLSLATLVQAGRFRLYGNTGTYLAFPLFSYGLFSPENGPASRRLDADLRACHPDIDYSAVNVLSSNGFVWGNLLTNNCRYPDAWSNDAFSALVTDAYVEAFVHRPSLFLAQIVNQSGVMLSFPVGQELLGLDLDLRPDWCVKSPWCWDMQERSGRHPAAKALLERWRAPINALMLRVTQPHLTLAAILAGEQIEARTAYEATPAVWLRDAPSITAAWLAMLGLVVATTRGSLRALVLGCVVFVHYTVFTVTTGHVFIPRYAMALGPFYAVLAAATVVTAARWVAAGAQRFTVSGAAISRARGASGLMSGTRKEQSW